MSKIFTSIWFYIGILFVVCLAAIFIQGASIRSLRDDLHHYKNNNEALLTEAAHFKVRDSLSAVKVEQLSLTIREYEKYRAADAEIIKDLKIKNKNLNSVNTVQSKMIAELRGAFHDTTIVYKVDTLLIEQNARHLHIEDPWITLDGYDRDGEFIGTVESRDSLIIATEVKYKRFLGFLWETNKVDKRSVSVMSKNPHTQLLNTEFVEIRK